jgi:hypothetical protein
MEVINMESPNLTSPIDMDELLTGDELCQKLKIKKSFLYAPARRKGPDALPCVIIGKYIRYRMHDVLSWIEMQQRSRRDESVKK